MPSLNDITGEDKIYQMAEEKRNKEKKEKKV